MNRKTKVMLSAAANIAALLLSVGALVFVAVVAAKWSGLTGFEPMASFIILSVTGFLLGYIIDVFLHELFHLLFGLMCGMSLERINLGPWTLHRLSGRFALERKKRGDSAVAGACAMLPKNDKLLRTKFAVYSLGGLFGSLVHIVLCVLSIVFRNEFGLAGYAFIAFGLPVAAYLFLINLIPAPHTDGGMVFGLLRKNAESEVMISVLKIQSRIYKGQSPSEVDGDLYFKLPVIREDSVNFIMLENMKYLYYLDKGDLEQAVSSSKRQESLLEYLPEVYLESVVSDLVFDYSVLRTDKERAELYYEQCKDYLESVPSVTNLRILASYAVYVENDSKKAEELITRAKEQLPRLHVKGLAKFESKLLEELTPLSDKEEVPGKKYIFKPRLND